MTRKELEEQIALVNHYGYQLRLRYQNGYCLSDGGVDILKGVVANTLAYYLKGMLYAIQVR